MAKPKPIGQEKIVFSSRLFKVTKQLMDEGTRQFEYETVYRPPGVRCIIVKDGKILLTKEHRTELGEYDYRLSGGMIFNSIDEVQDDVKTAAIEAAKNECLEEAGLIARKIEHYHTTAPGAKVQWDLHYFIINEFEEAKQICVDGKMKEDRSVGVLLRFLLQCN